MCLPTRRCCRASPTQRADHAQRRDGAVVVTDAVEGRRGAASASASASTIVQSGVISSSEVDPGDSGTSEHASSSPTSPRRSRDGLVEQRDCAIGIALVGERPGQLELCRPALSDSAGGKQRQAHGNSKRINGHAPSPRLERMVATGEGGAWAGLLGRGVVGPVVERAELRSVTR